MRIIITEEQNKRLLIVRRVLPTIERFMEQNLDPNDICGYWTKEESEDFVDDAMTELIIIIGSLDLKGIDSDELYDSLVDYGIKKKISEFFNNTIDNCDDE